MRVAIAGFMHESNTFNPIKTDRLSFQNQSYVFGPAMLDEWRAAHHEVGGFIEAGEKEGFEPIPLGMAWATPSGKVTAEAYEETIGKIVNGLKASPGDGLLLALHGAMVAESFDDADGETLTRIRRAMGPDYPIVVTLDLHGNISQCLVEQCQVAIAYRTNPHVDQRECGLRAASLMARIIRRDIQPTQALVKPPMLINIMLQDTSQPPLSEFIKEIRALEKKPGILAASLLPGFAYSDVEQMGPSIIVVADSNRELAEAEAKRIGSSLWNQRHRFTRELPDATTAVRLALSAEKLPVVLVDTGDNVGGGSAADGTVLLEELLRQGATDTVVCLFAPNEVQKCVKAGVGNPVQLAVGGKVDRLHGDPVPVKGRVRLLHDGTYLEHAVRHGGKRLNHMGLTALVEIQGNNLLVLNTQRHPPFSLGQLTCLGIQPQRQRILVVKAAIAYKAAYAPIAGTIIEVDTPGTTAVNPKRFGFRKARCYLE